MRFYINIFFVFHLTHITFELPVNDSSGFVVGGSVAEEGKYPYMISIKKNGHHICGGSILTKKTIVTAAHCVHGLNLKVMKIFAGSNNLNSKGVLYSIRSAKVHHKWNINGTHLNDVALIYLNENIKFNCKIQPIQLGKKVIGEGVVATLTGWGLLMNNGLLPNALQVIQLKIVSDELCSNSSLNLSSTLCTLNQIGEGACKGDSGGPLVVEDKLVGIVSRGVPCACGEPDVFTRVSYFVNWISIHTIY